jgi:hypothetical protein
MVERLVSVRVGWGEPTEDGDFIFNFHIRMGQTGWREIAEHKSLTALDIAFKASSKEFELSQFPLLTKKESTYIHQIMQNTNYDPKGLQKLESLRASVEVWVNTIMVNIARVSRDTRRLCRSLFFATFENTYRFDGWMREMGIYEGSLGAISETDETRSSHVIYSLLNGNSSGTQPDAVLSRRNLDKALKRKDHLRKNVAGTATINSDSRSESTRSIFRGFFNKSKSVVSEEETKEQLGDETLVTMSAHERIKVVLSSEVQRSAETQSGVQVYTVILRVRGKVAAPVVFRVFQRYSSFKQLSQQLVEINDAISNTAATKSGSAATTGGKAAPYANFIKLIASPFPASPVKSYLGLSLNEQEINERYVTLAVPRCATVHRSLSLYAPVVLQNETTRRVVPRCVLLLPRHARACPGGRAPLSELRHESYEGHFRPRPAGVGHH